MFGKKYLKLPKYYRGFRAVSVIFRCGGVLYFSLTFRYFSSDMTDYRGTFSTDTRPKQQKIVRIAGYRWIS